MSKLYSPSTRGFYDKAIHTEQIPADVLEIPDQEWSALIQAQERGNTIVPDENGHPIAIGPTPEQRAAARRSARDQLLAESDKLVNRHRDELEAGGQTSLSIGAYQALQTWRAQLRAITAHPDFPNVPMPPRPEGI